MNTPHLSQLNLFVANANHYRESSGSFEHRMEKLAAINRIHALSVIESANHGWLGASFSVTELLTVIYFHLAQQNVVLSKGHAAPMQYACLYGLGLIDAAQLLSYKDGPAGLQAHTDRRTPGILLDTGSLGQALSKAAGMAHVREEERFFVILGDGELQEGQCHEAFQTVAHRRMANLTIIVDLNGYQTSLRVDQIKEIASPVALFRGYGFDVEEIDGHDPAQIARALTSTGAEKAPRLILARTIKAGGSSLLGFDPTQPPAERCLWHGRVPDPELYLDIVKEQVEMAGDEQLHQEFASWLHHRLDVVDGGVSSSSGPDTSLALYDPRRRPASPPRDGSTGMHFSRELRRLATLEPRIVVLDADLASPCGIEEFPAAGIPFVEMGISEQDMVSFAGGLALSGRIPVVHTYASFFRRAYEQMAVNLGEGTRVIYAGHYAGLCYFTDGKTHQSLDDMALMCTLPGLTVIDPVDRRQTEGLLRWAVHHAPGSVYFRLRRSDLALDEMLTQIGATQPQAVPQEQADPPLPLPLFPPEQGRVLFTTGSVATALALKCRQEPDLADCGVVVQSVFGRSPNLDVFRRLLQPVRQVVTLEDSHSPGVLYPLLCDVVQRLRLPIAVQALQVRGPGWSFRTLDECLAHHGFVPARVRELLESTPGASPR